MSCAKCDRFVLPRPISPLRQGSGGDRHAARSKPLFFKAFRDYCHFQSELVHVDILGPLVVKCVNRHVQRALAHPPSFPCPFSFPTVTLFLSPSHGRGSPSLNGAVGVCHSSPIIARLRQYTTRAASCVLFQRPRSLHRFNWRDFAP